MLSLLRRALCAAAAAVAIVAVAACGGGATSDPGRTSRATVAVPQLVGREQEQAHAIAARAGLRLRWTGFAGKLANGRYNVGCAKILRQSPVAGERRPRGSLISVIEDACTTPRTAPTRPAGM